MVKGKRQRANKKSKHESACKCATCNPKKTKTLVTKETLLKNYPVRTLNTSDVNRFKELVTLSNNVAGLLKQCIDTDMSIEKGGDVAKQMLSGKIKGPAMQKITANLYLPLIDMKDVAKKIKGEIGMLKEANVITRGQLSQRYDEYIDSMKNLRTILDGLLANAPKQELKKILGDRSARGNAPVEQVIFEKEVAELTEKDRDYLKSIKDKVDKKAAEKEKHESACKCASCNQELAKELMKSKVKATR